MKKWTYLFIFPTFILAPSVEAAENISFEQLWSAIKVNSPALSSGEHEVRALQFGKSRADFAWLPSLALSGSVFSTNDPGANFISTLSQRQITAGDFNPTSLNQPGLNTFEQVSLGVNLPLYEGGMSVAQSAVSAKMLESASAKQDEVLLSTYADAASSYAKLTAVDQAMGRLNELFEKTSSILSHYSIGNRSNLVGYSGELGLKNLKNRTESSQNELQMEKQNLRSSLSIQAKINPDLWEPSKESVPEFIEKFLPEVISEYSAASFSEKSLQAKSEAIEKEKDLRNANYLPRLGLFADEGLIHGSRDTAASFTGGLYLKWSLFDPKNLNSLSEADEKRLSSISTTEQKKIENKISRAVLVQNDSMMKKNLKLLIESDQFLREQVKTSSKLYQAGSISALQLVEVFNRRLDLILQLKDLESKLIQTRAAQVALTQGEKIKL
jgi:outer membrane protein TolC